MASGDLQPQCGEWFHQDTPAGVTKEKIGLVFQTILRTLEGFLNISSKLRRE